MCINKCAFIKSTAEENAFQLSPWVWLQKHINLILLVCICFLKEMSNICNLNNCTSHYFIYSLLVLKIYIFKFMIELLI